MRIDLYTKVVLTLILLVLAVIALRPVIQPQAVVAQGNLTGVQFTYNGGGFLAIDTRTGDVWDYYAMENPGDGTVKGHYKITKLGQPLTH